MNNKLLILGAGGHGRVVKETAKAMGCFEKIDFLDDNSKDAIGNCIDYKKYAEEYANAFVALGNNERRKEWLEALRSAGYKLPVIVHPTAYVSTKASVGEGSFIGAKAVVNVNSIIEQGCILGIGALADHDSLVGEYSYINAGAIVKAGCKLNELMKVDAGEVYSSLV